MPETIWCREFGVSDYISVRHQCSDYGGKENIDWNTTKKKVLQEPLLIDTEYLLTVTSNNIY